jgi:hypothetical protein
VCGAQEPTKSLRQLAKEIQDTYLEARTAQMCDIIDDAFEPAKLAAIKEMPTGMHGPVCLTCDSMDIAGKVHNAAAVSCQYV